MSIMQAHQNVPVIASTCELISTREHRQASDWLGRALESLKLLSSRAPQADRVVG